MVGGGQADPMIDFGGDVKRRSEWVGAIKNRGGSDADVAQFDKGVKTATRQRISEHPEIAGQQRAYIGSEKKVSIRHKMEYPAEGARKNPQHVATYRGMTINTLPSYTTPYYYVDAPGFGSFHHTPSIGRIRRQVDTFKTTGATAAREKKRKGSERYQKRKARYG